MIVEAALIYEARLESMFDYVIVVDAPLEMRISRVMTRDGLRRAEVIRRVRSQATKIKTSKRADIVISTRNGKRKLAKTVAFVDHVLTAIAESGGPHLS